MAKYKLETGQFAIASWNVGSDWSNNIIRQMAETYRPEWTLVSVIKFPDGVKQESIYEGETNG